jgi:hypothetical protein
MDASLVVLKYKSSAVSHEVGIPLAKNGRAADESDGSPLKIED